MANAVSNLVLAIAGSVALSIIVKATFLLALTLLATYLLRCAKASVRHACLASTFGVLLVLPVAALLMPPITVEVGAVQRDGSETAVVVAQDTALENPVAITSANPSGDITTRRPISIGQAAWMVWAIGVTGILFSLSVALWRVQRLRREGIPWLEGEILVRRLAGHTGVSRPVDLLVHEAVVAPMSCGFIRPAIVLPTDAPAWSKTDLQHALVHELEHVHRADWLVQLLARVVCSLYWFHPLVWAASRRLCLEAERACDDAVLTGADQSAYAEQLLRLARRLSDRDHKKALMAMAGRSDLSARIAAVLEVGRARGRAGSVWVTGLVLTAMLSALVVSPLAAVPPSAAPSQVLQTQTGDDRALAFEVASIKPQKPGDLTPPRVGFPPGGRFEAIGATLQDLIALAYGEFQRRPEIIGGPDWIKEARFDVVAKVESSPGAASGPPGPQMFSMIRTLLADRFKLVTHNETRQLPIYALVLARGDGRLGPQLRRAEDCTPANRPKPAPRSPGQINPCGIGRQGPGRIAGRGVPLAPFVSGSLTSLAGRVVVDRTGLVGFFDWDLEWSPSPGEPALQSSPDGLGATQVVGEGPSIFTALQEQLGLRLESTRGPVEVLVIDSVQRPSSDEIGLTTDQAPSLITQSSATSVNNPAFEVESIKSTKTNAGQITRQIQPGERFNSATTSTGGGLGSSSQVDAANFCCPDYLVRLIDRIRTNWVRQADVEAINVLEFTIQRDGRIADVVLEESSGFQDLDSSSQRALLLTKTLDPLPAEFLKPTLTVHLNFKYQR